MPNVLEESLDNVPAALHEFYTERDGKYVLTGIQGVRSQLDIDKLQESLRKERNDHSQAKETLRKFNGLTPDEVHQKLDRVNELEEIVKTSGKVDEAAIDKMVEVRVRTKLNPIERELATIKSERDAFSVEIEGFKNKEKVRSIYDTVRALTLGDTAKVKIIPEALEDVLMYAERTLEIAEDGVVRTRDNIGVTPGLDAEVWLQDMLGKKPHWAGATVGGGASGSGRGTGVSGPNPFSKDGWNMTQQAALIRSNPKKAEQYAAAAGTTIGGARPR